MLAACKRWARNQILPRRLTPLLRSLPFSLSPTTVSHPHTALPTDARARTHNFSAGSQLWLLATIPCFHMLLLVTPNSTPPAITSLTWLPPCSTEYRPHPSFWKHKPQDMAIQNALVIRSNTCDIQRIYIYLVQNALKFFCFFLINIET